MLANCLTLELDEADETNTSYIGQILKDHFKRCIEECFINIQLILNDFIQRN